MAGQGRPRASKSANRRGTFCRYGLAGAADKTRLASSISIPRLRVGLANSPPHLRVRASLRHSGPRVCRDGLRGRKLFGPRGVGRRGRSALWGGTISLSQGTLSEPRPVGIEADEPGTMWLRGWAIDRPPAPPAQLRRRRPLARRREGREAVGELDRVRRWAAPAPRIEIPLADLSTELWRFPLDRSGNQLLVRRAGRRCGSAPRRPDGLWSAQMLKFDVTPHLLGVPDDAKVHLKVQLSAGPGRAGLVVHAAGPAAQPCHDDPPGDSAAGRRRRLQRDDHGDAGRHAARLWKPLRPKRTRASARAGPAVAQLAPDATGAPGTRAGNRSGQSALVGQGQAGRG